LVGNDYIYLWADGVHFNIHLEYDRLACLTLIGFLPDGTKEVMVLEDGYRESTESWKTLLRDLERRGMPEPKLTIADGALGY
jgi:transposase-like protein